MKESQLYQQPLEQTGTYRTNGVPLNLDAKEVDFQVANTGTALRPSDGCIFSIMTNDCGAHYIIAGLKQSSCHRCRRSSVQRDWLTKEPHLVARPLSTPMTNHQRTSEETSSARNGSFELRASALSFRTRSPLVHSDRRDNFRVSTKLSLALIVIAFAMAALSAIAQTNLQTQTFQLDPGWNLISFQLMPADPTPAAVFGDLGIAFERAWDFDNSLKTWSSYTRAGIGQREENTIASMKSIEVGRAYWIYMNQATNWQLIGTAPNSIPPLVFRSGWNLVGIPTGTGQLTEPVNMAAVMAASGMNYEVLLKWEVGQYKKFSNKDNPPDDFTVFDANKGYWINVTSNTFTMHPKLLSTVRPDVDNEPQGNYPGPEDLQLSSSAIPLDASSQTHVVFLPGEDVQQLSLANTGGGILLWRLVWNPVDAKNVNWFSMSATQGVTTVENDIVTLGLDRKNLVKGTYRGSLTLETTAGNRSFQVIANVPGVEGEWRGSAIISSVNSRKNPVPDIDLFLNFYEDAAVQGLLRGSIDSHNALLWPVDVPLIGHVQSSVGNTFTLSGGYVLPPGDQNNPPYDQFNPLMEDVDWNGNNRIDDLNPFPFPIYRAVTLQGELATASQKDGYTVKGHYLELIYGMLRDPIRMEGAFSIRRENATPFADRRPVLNQESISSPQPVVFLGTNYPGGLPLAGGMLSKLTIKTDLVLQDISLDLAILDAIPTNLTISLIGPNGVPLVLHDRANISPNTLAQVNFPGTRPPVQSFKNLLAASISSRGDWYLSITGIGGSLKSWSLRLQGQPVFDVSGRVVNSLNGSGLPAQLFLDGLPISEIATANSDGSFMFSRLPGIPLNFTANLPGFHPSNPAQPGLASVFTMPNFPTNRLSAAALKLAAKFRPLPVLPIPAAATDGFANFGSTSNPVLLELSPRTDLGSQMRIQADPPIGFGPLTVRFTALAGTSGIPPGTFTTWVFGDGSGTNGLDLLSIEHTYSTVSAAGYTVQMLTGLGSPTNQIFVLPSPGVTPYSNNFFQVFFTSGGAVPPNLINTIASSYPMNGPPQLVGLIRIQHADCASFDIDRAPHTTAENRDFFADGFSTSGQISAGASIVTIPIDETSNGFKEEDSNYFLDPLAWTTNLWLYAGDCGYAVDDSIFTPHPKPNINPTQCNGLRFRMLCNIGPQIVPPPNDEVYAITPNMAPLPPPAPDPLFEQGREGIATARDLCMIVGPLAWSWHLTQE
jgi:subtilisin-like proprotein convertase family protein